MDKKKKKKMRNGISTNAVVLNIRENAVLHGSGTKYNTIWPELMPSE